MNSKLTCFLASVVQSILEALPLDTSVIADAVYASSTTMDARHFAAEYVRRKKQAEKGLVEKQTGADNRSASGGWSEVAKKGGNSSNAQPAKEADGAGMQGAGFKVVPSKKKGKK